MKTIELKISVPDSTIKKIKAWTLLMDDDVSPDAAIAVILDDAVSQEIINCLGISTHAPTQMQPMVREVIATQPPRPVQITTTNAPNPSPLGRPDGLMDYDNSSIELGDTDDEEDHDAGEEAEGEEAFVPSQGGLSEDSLERDMELDDPEHEAVSEGFRDNPRSSAEDMFSSTLNLPQMPSSQVDPGVTRRAQLKINTQGRRRARVSGYGGAN